MIRQLQTFTPTMVMALLLMDTVLILGCYLLAAAIAIEPSPMVFLLYEGGFAHLSLVAISMLLAMHFNDLYSEFRSRSHFAVLLTLCSAMGATLIIEGLISYFSPELRTPRTVMMLGSLLSIIVLFLCRLIYFELIWKFSVTRILFVGDNPALDEMSEILPGLGMQLAGYVAESPEIPRKGGKVIGPISQLGEIVRNIKPDRLIVGMKERRARMPTKELLDLRFAGFVVEDLPRFIERACGRISIAELRPAQLVFSSELGPQKSLFGPMVDFCFAFIALACLLPLILLIAIAIRLTSRGPALYTQTRVGRNGKHFTLYKFRSMFVDAENLTGAVWSITNDPRVTALGRILRKLRLDELPQLFQVLRGEMALVGPRPERPEFVEILTQKIPYYRHRHSVKPGITGWAQINYKYGDTFQDAVRKLEYDLYYIKYQSASLDAYILFATVKTMLLTRGAQ